MICNQVFVNSFMYQLSAISIMSLCSASHVPVGRPGLAPNATLCERLVVVGLPVAAQTPPQCGHTRLGQAPKQEGASCYNRPLAGHGLGAGPSWTQPPFQTRPWSLQGNFCPLGPTPFRSLQDVGILTTVQIVLYSTQTRYDQPPPQPIPQRQQMNVPFPTLFENNTVFSKKPLPEVCCWTTATQRL
jgi:hypothetical protein